MKNLDYQLTSVIGRLHIQWSPSKTDTTGTKDFVLYSEMSLAQELVADHAPLPIVANSNAAVAGSRVAKKRR